MSGPRDPRAGSRIAVLDGGSFTPAGSHFLTGLLARVCESATPAAPPAADSGAERVAP